MKPYIFLRGLRAAEHTVFCVQDGQKTYYDPEFARRVAYSSGQQVKRSILDALSERLGEPRAPITFNYQIKKDNKGIEQIEQKEPWSPCDPTFADQLLGGWMRAKSDSLVLKRRSPLSISAMRPLHPLLVAQVQENLTFDRSEHPEQHPVRVLNAAGQEMSGEDIDAFLQSKQRSLPRRHWIPDNTRTTGIFVFDVAIDLRRLFSVSLNQHDPELDPGTIARLREDGWQESPDGLNLVCPKNKRDKIIPALADGLINWRVTSNQARTYSPQTMLAVAISDDANRIAGSIRADLSEDSEHPRAIPVVEEIDGVELFVSLAARGYVPGVTIASADSIEKGQEQLVTRLMAFDYDVSTRPVQV